MVSRKRTRQETEGHGAAEPTQEHGLLHQLRNMWEFANLMQYIYSFGKMMKIDDSFDIEVRLDYIRLCLMSEMSATDWAFAPCLPR